MSVLQLTAFGQHTVKLRSGHYVPEAKIILKKSVQPAASNSLSKAKSAIVSQGEYVIIQFHAMPSALEKTDLAKAGIQLLEYVPDFAFITHLKASVQESTLKSIANVRSVAPFKASDKIDPKFGNKASYKHAVKSNGEIALQVTLFKDANKASVVSQMAQLGIEADTQTVFKGQIIGVKATFDEIQAIAAIEEIQFITVVSPKEEVFALQTNANHRVNAVQSTIVGAKNLRGEGIVVGVGDNGVVYNHSDLQNRVTLNDQSGNGLGEHATHVTGIIGGNGNLSDIRAGIATKATFVVGYFSTLIYEAPSFVNNYGMVLTNNSYGIGPGGEYNQESVLADDQLVAYPNLLHVFASGNPGSDYGLVGNAFPSSKNILTVGSVDITNTIASYSGRGPCKDGRLKPEIVTIGSDVPSTLITNGYDNWYGTSMAAPAATGGLALLYEEYKKLKNVNPDAGLMKAILCNTADDLGNAGPDYTYGFGRMNVKKAIQSIDNATYIQASVNAGASKTHSIAVPAGTTFVKVMLYWKDKAASISASVALVNNLNLSVLSGSTTYLPWVLSPSNPAAVATRGVDNLNNIEQVTIVNPAAGNLTLTVNGAGISSGVSQDYAIAYEFTKNGIELTYPIGGEVIEPAKTEIIRWDAYGTAATTDLFYSTNNGSSWTTIATGVPTATGSYTWTVPNLTNENVTFKAVSGSATSITTNKTVLLGTPLVTVNERNGTNINLEWAPVTGASSYEVFLLKRSNKEIVSIGTTTGLSYTIPNIAASDTVWASVRAVTATSKTGRRSYATAPTVVQCKFTGAKLSGTTIGTEGAWDGVSTRDKVFDLDVNTYFDAPTDAAWVGLNLTSASKIGGIRYYPRAGAADRMVGGKFQGSNTADFSSAVDLSVITTQPPYNWNCVAISNATAFKYVRYVGPAGGFGNVAELQFFGPAPNVAPTVAINSPLALTSVEATTLEIKATASDPDGSVAQVDFYIGSNIVGTDYTAPYSYTWSNIAPGTYILTARAMDNEGAFAFHTITGVTVKAPTSPLFGPACGTNNASLVYELNAAQKANATGYNWYYTGAAQSITPVAGSPFKATLATGASFGAGQVCVGINYSVSPWYASYCVAVAKCAGARFEEAEEEVSVVAASVAPNPTSDQFHITLGNDAVSVVLMDELGQTVYQQVGGKSGDKLSTGDQLSTGLYQLVIRYTDGQLEKKKLVKIQ